jgi:dTDP-4-amino-4,6-dideoxygalactose transaminase
MERIPLVGLSRIHEAIRGEIDSAVGRVVDSGRFILGPEVEAFEKAFAEHCGAVYAVGLDNGSSALELGLRALGLGPGDEVIVPALTFVATASSVLAAGAVPVIADIDPESLCLDPAAAAAARTPRTRAAIAVHLHGRPADTEALGRALGPGVALVEDACQAHGASLRGRRAGNMGRFAAFSFYPSKNLGALGDAGTLTTNDETVAEKVAVMRNYGQRAKYDHVMSAYNRRLDSLQAAVLRAKLPHLASWNAERRRLARLYRELLAGTGVGLPGEPAGGEHVYHVFAVRSPARDALARHLEGQGVETGIHYPVSLSRTGFLKASGALAGPCPNAEKAANELLSLPMFPGLRDAEVERVAKAIRAFNG